MKRLPIFAGMLLAGAALYGAEAPPAAVDQTPPPKTDESQAGKTSEAPAPPAKHRLGGSFKGHPIPPSTAEASKPAARPAAAPSGKKKSSRLVIDNALVKSKAAPEDRSSATGSESSAEPANPAPPPPVTMPKILDLEGHDEAYWKAKAAATRDAVQKAHETLAAAQAEEKREENDFYAWDDGQYRDNVIKPAWDRARDETVRAQADLETAQKQLDDLEDEARRAGAYPGWIR